MSDMDDLDKAITIFIILAILFAIGCGLGLILFVYLFG